MQRLLSLAVLAASAGSAHAASASVYNYCSFPVSLWAVDTTRAPSSPQTIAPGASFTEEYHQPASGGVSLKLSNTTSCAHPTQFEYTLTGSNIWYDGSNVDCWQTGCPFDAYGIHMETSDPACPTRTCQPGAPKCDGFYNLFNDDLNSLSCGATKDIKMYLCSTSASPSGGGSAPALPNAAPPPAGLPAVSSANNAPAAASSKAAKYQMEAVHGMPTTLKIHARATPEARHVHMRRHMHHPQHKN